MEAASRLTRCQSLLLPLILTVSVVSALELSSRLMTYVLEEFGEAAHQRLENWHDLR